MNYSRHHSVYSSIHVTLHRNRFNNGNFYHALGLSWKYLFNVLCHCFMTLLNVEHIDHLKLLSVAKEELVTFNELKLTEYLVSCGDVPQCIDKQDVKVSSKSIFIAVVVSYR